MIAENPILSLTPANALICIGFRGFPQGFIGADSQLFTVCNTPCNSGGVECTHGEGFTTRPFWLPRKLN